MAATPSGKDSKSPKAAAPLGGTAESSLGTAHSGAGPSGDASSDSSDEYLGKTFGKYRVTKRIGNGGMAVVYQADDLLMKRQVAMKFLSGVFLHKPAAVERFMREAQVAGRLSHPNIIAIHDVSKEARACFIVMELLSPGSAGQHLKQKGPYYWVVATRIIADCCAALKVAHDAGVIHRDLTLRNDSSWIAG
jgi:serine/threonine protein kinase